MSGQEQRAARAPGVATPRPWVATKHGDTKGWTISSSAGSNSIASVRPNPRRVAGPEEVEANAQLIVAAVNSHAEREAELARVTELAAAWEREVVHYREVEYALREELRVARETASALAGALADAVEWLQPHTLAVQDVKRDAERALAGYHDGKGSGEPRRDDDPVPGRPSSLPIRVEVEVDDDGPLITAVQGAITPHNLMEIQQSLADDDFFADGKAHGVYLCRPEYEPMEQEGGYVLNPGGWWIDGADHIADLPTTEAPQADIHDVRDEHAPAGGGVGLP